VAFPLVCKLLALNKDGQHRVEVTLISRNSADTGLRIFNSIRHHVWTSPVQRLLVVNRLIGISVPLARICFVCESGDVQRALNAGIAAATIMPSANGSDVDGQLRIAFDGDAVLFSDEAERVFAESGLEAFNRTETEAKIVHCRGTV